MRIANSTARTSMSFGELMLPLASLGGRFAILFGIVVTIGFASFRIHDNFNVAANGDPLRKYQIAEKEPPATWEAALRSGAVQ